MTFPLRLATCLAALFALTVNPSPAQESAAANARIGRGINLGNALEAPPESSWTVKVDEAYFDTMKKAGFQSVRIPTKWATYAAQEAPYTIDEAFFQKVDKVVEQALARDLVVILNVHHFTDFMRAPEAQKERLLGLWKQIATRYKDTPSNLYFEVLNEPTNKVSAELWNPIQNEVIALMRESNPDRTILVAPVGWNRIDELANLKLPEGDTNLIASVHFYEPFPFTHQGANWVGWDPPVGVEWNGTPEEKAKIDEMLDKAKAWSDANGIAINIGEFGAYDKGDLASRARWTEHVRSAAEARDFSWNYWEFCSGFGAYDAKAKAWRQPLLEALIPQDPKAAQN